MLSFLASQNWLYPSGIQINALCIYSTAYGKYYTEYVQKHIVDLLY